jgi:hypothetical protein
MAAASGRIRRGGRDGSATKPDLVPRHCQARTSGRHGQPGSVRSCQLYAIAVVADLALAVLLVALSGFIFGGGPEGMHGEAGAATVWWASFIVTLAAPILGILLLRRGRPGVGVLIAWAPVIIALLFASI